MAEVIQQIVDKVIEGNIPEVESLTQEAVKLKLDPENIMNEGFIPGLEVVGKKYTDGEFFLPEMIMAGMAVKGAMEILKPLVTKSGGRLKGTVVIGTVLGDTHDIGKNIVSMMLEGGGFRVIDLGTDVSAEKFIEAIRVNNADIVAMSALISTTRANMPNIIKEIHASGLDRSKPKVMVGGAPVTQDFADNIGADGYAPDAGLAVKKAKELLGVN